MLAATITVQGFPLLHLEDKVSFALQCMDDFDVQELAVVKEDYFLGLVQKADLLDTDEAATIMVLSEQLRKIMIADTAHFLTALDFFSKHQLSILPVLNEQLECIGMIPQKSLNDALAKFLGVNSPGAIIVLSVAPYQYSLAEMSRLVESNNAQILQLNSCFDETNGAMIITLKINKDEAQSIIATFQRYDYQLVQYFGKTPLHNDIEAHYHHLMNYLDV
jgi:predicted transcriptional regulator